MYKVYGIIISCLFIGSVAYPSKHWHFVVDDVDDIISQINDLQMTINGINKIPTSLKQQGDPIVILPDLNELDYWKVPCDIKMEAIQSTPLEVIVPYILQKLKGHKSVERRVRFKDINDVPELVMTELTFEGRFYHHWAQKGAFLEYTRWRNGEIKTRNEQRYQCRDGYIVCEKDLVKHMSSFEDYFQYHQEIRSKIFKIIKR